MYIGIGVLAIGVSSDGDGTDGGCCGCCAKIETKVSLVMMLVGTLSALGVKLTPESRLSDVVYCVQEWPSLW